MSTQLQEFHETLLLETLEKAIVVYNDDFNTFDHVIETFVKILGHSPHQAEQCAMLIHFKGKCKVKQGSYEELEPLCTSILEKGLSAEIH
jgi:ATP-dependent Clp protease adaptor protein ClpS